MTSARSARYPIAPEPRGTLDAVRFSGLGIAVALASAGCSFSVAANGTEGTDAQPADGADSGGVSVRRVTVAATSEALTGFPVWFVLDDASFGADAQAHGGTPYFTKTDGGPIAYEIQRWDAGTGHLEAWVKVDIDPVHGAAFDLHEGPLSSTNAANSAAVFASPFAAAWHFDPSAGSLLADAHGAVNGTAIGGPVTAPGKLGGGLAFDGADDEVSFQNMFAGDNPHTFSAWVIGEVNNGTAGTIITLGEPMTNRARWLHTRFPGIAAGFYNGNDFKPATGNIQIGTQATLVHWVYDIVNNERRTHLYRDGVEVATSDLLNANNDTRTAAGHIGNAPGGFGACALRAVLDEVRIATVARRPAWIAAEFANQSAPTSFYTVAKASE